MPVDLPAYVKKACKQMLEVAAYVIDDVSHCEREKIANGPDLAPNSEVIFRLATLKTAIVKHINPRVAVEKDRLHNLLEITRRSFLTAWCRHSPDAKLYRFPSTVWNLLYHMPVAVVWHHPERVVEELDDDEWQALVSEARQRLLEVDPDTTCWNVGWWMDGCDSADRSLYQAEQVLWPGLVKAAADYEICVRLVQHSERQYRQLGQRLIAHTDEGETR